MNRVVWFALSLATFPLAAAGPDAAQEERAPRYVQRLELPSRTDGFRRPGSVTADLHAGEVFVCDTWNNRVVIYDQLGSYRYQIHGGTVFRAPTDIAVGPEGFIFLLGWRKAKRSILKLDFDGLLVDEIPIPTHVDSDLPPEPVSLAIAPDGDRLYVLDRAAHRLWILSREGKILASTDLSGESTEEDLQERIYGHVDAYGDRVLVAIATLGKVLLFDQDGQPRGRVGRKGTAQCQSAFPLAGAMDRDGNVFVLDKQRMLFTLWRSKDNTCIGEYSGIGRSEGALYAPDDLALDGRGRIYISQTFEGRVQIFDGATPAPVPEPAAAPGEPTRAEEAATTGPPPETAPE